MDRPIDELGDEFMAPIFADTELALRTVLTPLDAEVIGSQLLGTVALSLQRTSPKIEVTAGIEDFLVELAEYAERQATSGALAVLRAVGSVAPTAQRTKLLAAANRLVETGKTDRAWMNDLGKPSPVRSWRCGDRGGAQDGITAVFSYGRVEHALVVLLDHQLGGGIKDCWLSDNPDSLWKRSQEASRSPAMRLIEMEWADTRGLLEEALALPACPTSSDQVQDVATNVSLLRSRVRIGPAGLSLVVSEPDLEG